MSLTLLIQIPTPEKAILLKTIKNLPTRSSGKHKTRNFQGWMHTPMKCKNEVATEQETMEGLKYSGISLPTGAIISPPDL